MCSFETERVKRTIGVHRAPLALCEAVLDTATSIEWRPHEAFENADAIEQVRTVARLTHFDETPEMEIARADLDNDGRAEIITGTNPTGGNSRVRILNGQTGSEITSFEAFPGFLGGTNVSALDRNNDGRSEIVATVASGTSSRAA